MQQSCGKVMFLHLCVILFTGGFLSRGPLSKWVSVQGGLCLEVSVQGGLRGSLSRGPMSSGVSVRETTPILVMCGRYASYWNTFLLPPETKLGQGNIFRSVCQEFCPRGMSGSRHSSPPPAPGVDPPPSSASWEIRPTSGWYASYWNAYFFNFKIN